MKEEFLWQLITVVHFSKLCARKRVVAVAVDITFSGHGIQGWTGKLFFSRGGAGRGGARPKIYGAGNPPFSTARGGAGKGSKSAGQGEAGAGNILRESAD